MKMKMKSKTYLKPIMRAQLISRVFVEYAPFINHTIELGICLGLQIRR
jgi:hypothetical protein